MSLMLDETREAPVVIARMLARNRTALADLGARLRTTPPPVAVTCARGSSDHAALYGKYLIERYLGVPVASVAPSLASLFAAPVATGGALCIAVSQSGRSPDLLAAVAAYRDAGSAVVALVNDETSPLAIEAETLLPLDAGPECSVAATKSCLAAMAGFAALVAAWSQDAELAAAVDALPDLLECAVAQDWSAAIAPLSAAERMFVVARGFGLGVANEMALKLKETCAIQAEPFSAAEVRHGPMTIVGENFPVLAIATSDAAGEDVVSVAEAFAARGATVMLAQPGSASGLPAIAAHPAVEPLGMLASFYGLVEALSRARGRDPDRPPHLSKVTRTR